MASIYHDPLESSNDCATSKQLLEAQNKTEEHRAVVDEQRTQIALERRILNSTIPKIAIIPADLLSHIFYDTVHDSQNTQRELKRAVYGALTVAQVCYWWRRLALETPSLWSSLIISRKVEPERLQRTLALSAECALNLTLILIPETEETIHQILDHASHRLFRLLISVDTDYAVSRALERRTSESLQTTAELRQLALQSSLGNQRDLILPSFVGDLAKCESIQLSGWRFPWSSRSLRMQNLKALTMTDTSPPEGVSLDDILYTFTTLTSLETLCISFSIFPKCYPEVWRKGFESHNIQLPSLREFDLIMDTPKSVLLCVYFLRFVTTPIRTLIGLQFRRRFKASEYLPLLIDAVREKLRDSQAGLQHWQISVEGATPGQYRLTGEQTVSAFKNVYPITEHTQLDPAQAELRIRFAVRHSRIFMNDFVYELPLHETHSLAVLGPSGTHENLLMVDMPNLEILSLHDFDAIELYEGVFRMDDDSLLEDMEYLGVSYPLRNLRQLLIRHVDLTENVHYQFKLDTLYDGIRKCAPHIPNFTTLICQAMTGTRHDAFFVFVKAFEEMCGQLGRYTSGRVGVDSPPDNREGSVGSRHGVWGGYPPGFGGDDWWGLSENDVTRRYNLRYVAVGSGTPTPDPNWRDDQTPSFEPIEWILIVVSDLLTCQDSTVEISPVTDVNVQTFTNHYADEHGLRLHWFDLGRAPIQ
ncbi:hypothetical protein K474DRAFT_1698086 [Panus rudis PR-1116 ss-1]|nr:hypothetical protein K474DRAFT_1698086 [Panus rudis PR-1116 ss-1]